MNKRVFQCILLVLLIGILSCSEYPKRTEPFECVLEGEVKGWPECSSLVLIEAEKREEAVPAVSIPVVDGKFEYTFHDSVNRLYLKEIYETVYKEKYTDHPYQKEIKDMLGSLEVKEGASFVDFIAPDLDGYQHRLSDLIKGKYVLLDLWASWCGPCRSYSKDMIPVYEKYKNRGFTVVGIAREVNNTEAMRRAVEKDGYPWINLVDLNDRVGVWTKYGVLSAGRRLLIDSTGKILALDPRSEEVEKLLEEHLN